MSYCRIKGSSLENQPRCIITLITAHLTCPWVKEDAGTVSIWRTNHFLQGGKLEDTTVTCLEDRTVRGKKAGTEEGTGREESLEAPGWGKARQGSWGLFLLPCLLGDPFLGPAYTPLSTAGLLLTPKASKPSLGLPGPCVWRAWGVKLN